MQLVVLFNFALKKDTITQLIPQILSKVFYRMYFLLQEQ